MLKKIAEIVKKISESVREGLNDAMEVDSSWEYTAPVSPKYGKE